MHRQIYRAIRDHNSEAARSAMRDHLVLAQKAQESEVPGQMSEEGPKIKEGPKRKS